MYSKAASEFITTSFSNVSYLVFCKEFLMSYTFICFCSEMEQHGVLDPENESDLFCLHYLAGPLIRTALTRFVMSWNHHSLRTEGHKSPLQLFFAGLENLRQQAAASEEHFTELEQVFIWLFSSFVSSFQTVSSKGWKWRNGKRKWDANERRGPCAKNYWPSLAFSSLPSSDPFPSNFRDASDVRRTLSVIESICHKL